MIKFFSGSGKEEDELLAKVRKGYDDFIATYMKSISLKDNFESRLMEARKSKFNIKLFLQTELEALEDMNTVEKKNFVKLHQAAKIQKAKKSIADRVIEERMHKLSKYQEVEIGENANTEIGKLFGALVYFGETYWNTIESVIIKNNFNVKDQYYKLSSGVNDMCRISEHGLPHCLYSYKLKLDSTKYSEDDIDSDERKLFMEAAMFISSMKSIIVDVMPYNMPEHHRSIINKAVEYLDEVLVNFRLQDLRHFFL